MLERGRRPVVPVEVNKAHPLGKGLEVCWLGDRAPIDVVGHSSLVTYGGNATHAVTSKGWAFSTDGTGDYVRVSKPFNPGDKDRITVSLWAIDEEWWQGGDDYLNVVGEDSIIFRAGIAHVKDAAGSYSGAVTVGTNANGTEIQHRAITYDGTTLTGYNNGAFGSSTSVTGLYSSTADFVLGINQDLSARAVKGKIWGFCVWDRALSAEEILSINLDPYQFLIPK